MKIIEFQYCTKPGNVPNETVLTADPCSYTIQQPQSALENFGTMMNVDDWKTFESASCWLATTFELSWLGQGYASLTLASA